MISDGRHDAKVLDVEFGKSSNGNEQVAVRFELDDGERIVWWGYFTDAAIASTMDAFDAMGWSPDRCDFEDVDNPVLSFWEKVSLVIETEEGQDGKPRSRVRWVNSLGGPMNKTPLEDKGKKLMGAKMRALYKSKGVKPKPRQAAQVHEPEILSVDEDDTPF